MSRKYSFEMRFYGELFNPVRNLVNIDDLQNCTLLYEEDIYFHKTEVRCCGFTFNGTFNKFNNILEIFISKLGFNIDKIDRLRYMHQILQDKSEYKVRCFMPYPFTEDWLLEKIYLYKDDCDIRLNEDEDCVEWFNCIEFRIDKEFEYVIGGNCILTITGDFNEPTVKKERPKTRMELHQEMDNERRKRQQEAYAEGVKRERRELQRIEDWYDDPANSFEKNNRY